MVVSENITLSGPTVITKTTRHAVITSDMGETPKTVSPHLSRRGKRCGRAPFVSRRKKKKKKKGKSAARAHTPGQGGRAGGRGEVRF